MPSLAIDRTRDLKEPNQSAETEADQKPEQNHQAEKELNASDATVQNTGSVNAHTKIQPAVTVTEEAIQQKPANQKKESKAIKPSLTASKQSQKLTC